MPEIESCIVRIDEILGASRELRVALTMCGPGESGSPRPAPGEAERCAKAAHDRAAKTVGSCGTTLDTLFAVLKPQQERPHVEAKLDAVATN